MKTVIEMPTFEENESSRNSNLQKPQLNETDSKSKSDTIDFKTS